MSFTTYNPASHTLASLVSAIFGTSAGVTIQPGSISVRHGAPSGEASTISFYNGSIAGLNIGSGLLLTSGDPTPPLADGSNSYGQDAGSGAVDATDSDLQGTVQAAFSGAGTVRDVTWLQFEINVTDPAAAGVRFEVVFGSDEYPEYSNSSYVDVAGVYVNGQNYALFNNNPATPLSVVKANVDNGNFRNNEGNAAAGIEYDGISVKLQITAPIHQGVNTIKIAVADTGDSIYDSGIFVSGMQAVNYSGFGLSQQVNLGSTTYLDTPFNQTYVGTSGDNNMHFGSGGGGMDVYDGGDGIDAATYDAFLSQITGIDWNGSVLTLSFGDDATTLVNVERVLLGDDTYAALDMQAGDRTLGVYAMWWAAFHDAPGMDELSQWLAHADELDGDLGALGDLFIDTYAGAYDDATIITYLYYNIVGLAPSAAQLDSLLDMIEGTTTIGDLFAIGAQLSLNIDDLPAGIIGSIQQLDPSYFGL
jgi:hypothetical protein